MENGRHHEWLYRLTRYLADQHVLFELATERQLNEQGLAPYQALIVPAARYVSDSQIKNVLEFARSGRTVVLIGESGTHEQLLSHFGLTARGIASAVREALSRKRSAELASGGQRQT